LVSSAALIVRPPALICVPPTSAIFVVFIRLPASSESALDASTFVVLS